MLICTLSAKFPQPDDRNQFGQLLFGKRELSYDEEKYLTDWLCVKKEFFKVDLSSSAKSNVNFIQQLDMNGGN